MSDEIATEVTETEQPVKRGRGRPRKVIPEERKVTRKTRVPLGGFAGPLTLTNKDPNYHYYWELDSEVTGAKIERRMQAGYEFCRPEEKLVVGSTSVYKTENVGSIIRVPAGHGDYHYLMKIPQEWYEDDQQRHNERVDLTEQSLKSQNQKEGFYGSVNIG